MDFKTGINRKQEKIEKREEKQEYAQYQLH